MTACTLLSRRDYGSSMARLRLAPRDITARVFNKEFLIREKLYSRTVNLCSPPMNISSPPMNISSCTANIKTLSFQFISFTVQHEFLSEYLAVNNAREHQSCMAKQKKTASRDAGLEIGCVVTFRCGGSRHEDARIRLNGKT